MPAATANMSPLPGQPGGGLATGVTPLVLPPTVNLPPPPTTDEFVPSVGGTPLTPLSAITSAKLVSREIGPAGFPIRQFVFPNGHRVMVEETDQDFVSLRTFIRAGSCNERAVYNSPLYAPNPFPSGIAHLDEHCHFLSTQHYPGRNAWVNTMERLGARANASTGYETIQHELVFNREDLQNLLHLHGEALLNPNYDDSLLFQEKRNVLNECSERMAPPDAVMYSKLMELTLDRPHFQSLGNRPEVEAITADQLKAFYNAYYTPSNMITVISGKLKAEDVLPALERSFGQNRLDQPTAPENTVGLKWAIQPAHGWGEVRTLTMQDPQLTTSHALLGFKGPANTQLKDRVAMQCLLALLADGPLSSLQGLLQDRLQLVSGLAMEQMPQKYTGMVTLSMTMQPGQEQTAVNAALGVLHQVAQAPPSAQRVEALKNQMLDGYRRAMSSAEFRTELMGGEALNHSLAYYTQYEALVKSLTPQDLQRVAQTYLNSGQMAAIYAQPGPQRSFSQKIATLTSPNGQVVQRVLPSFQPQGTIQTPVLANSVVPATPLPQSQWQPMGPLPTSPLIFNAAVNQGLPALPPPPQAAFAQGGPQ